MRSVSYKVPTQIVTAFHDGACGDEKEGQLEQQLTRHQSNQPTRFFSHERILVDVDVPLKQVLSERWDDALREHHLGIDEYRRGNVRDKVREERESGVFRHRHGCEEIGGGCVRASEGERENGWFFGAIWRAHVASFRRQRIEKK